MESAGTYQHGSRPWTAATDTHSETLLVPLGSTEQHGPHLPFDTDTRIACAVANHAAAMCSAVVVAPAVAYGSSGEHQAFPGTLSIGNEALAFLLTELGRSALPQFGHVVIVNGHGGNHTAVTAAIATLTHEQRSASAWWPSMPGSDAHAGRTETSLMLAIGPESVDLAAAEAGNTTPIAELIPDLIADGVRPHAPNGIMGDPAGASAREGSDLLDRLVLSLVDHIEARRSSN